MEARNGRASIITGLAAVLCAVALLGALVLRGTADRPAVAVPGGLSAPAINVPQSVSAPGPVETSASASTSALSAAPSDVASGAELGRTPLGGYVSRLAYDATADALWYAIFDIAGPDRLVRFDIPTGRTTTFELPDADYDGLLSTIRVAHDGSVWLSQPYRLIRFDPISATMRTLDLPTADAGAVVGALDPGNPVPGTWISSFAFVEGGAILARNNDPHLYSVGTDLVMGTSTPLPRAYAGALDLHPDPATGGVYALPGLGQTGGVALLDRDGRIVSQVATSGHRFSGDAVNGVVAGAPDGARWLDGAPVDLASRGGGSIDDLAALAPDGSVVVYDARTSTLQRVAHGTVVASLPLERTGVTIHRPDGDVNAQGVTRVNDLAVDAHGVTWYIDGGTNELVGVRL